MFYIKNLSNGTELSFPSKRAVLSYWRWQISRENRAPLLAPKFDFSELNITGKDTMYAIVNRTVLVPTYLGLYTYEYGWRLKKYQVLDEDRRSCDIREWKQEIKEVLAENYPTWFSRKKFRTQEAKFRSEPVEFCSKRSHPNNQYPAFTRQRLEAYHNNHELDPEDDLLGFTPMTDHSKPRKLDWTYKKDKKSDTHSWKSTTKNRSQWGRHMDRAPERSLRKGRFLEVEMLELPHDEVDDDYMDLIGPEDVEPYVSLEDMLNDPMYDDM